MMVVSWEVIKKRLIEKMEHGWETENFTLDLFVMRFTALRGALARAFAGSRNIRLNCL